MLELCFDARINIITFFSIHIVYQSTLTNKTSYRPSFEVMAQITTSFQKEIDQLKDVKNKKRKSASVFKLKENIVGNKKQNQESIAITNPETKKLVFDQEKYIGNTYLSRELTKDILFSIIKDFKNGWLKNTIEKPW